MAGRAGSCRHRQVVFQSADDPVLGALMPVVSRQILAAHDLRLMGSALVAFMRNAVIRRFRSLLEINKKTNFRHGILLSMFMHWAPPHSQRCFPLPNL